MGEMHGLDKEAEGTLELLHDSLREDSEVNVRLLVEQVLGQLSDALGISLCLEAEALALQQSSEFLVVGDDSIMDNGELPVHVRSVDVKGVFISIFNRKRGTIWAYDMNLPVRMAVLAGRSTVGSPACVSNTSMRLKSLGQVRLALINELLQFCNLSNLFVGSHFLLLVAVNGKPGRVITSVLESRKSIEESVQDEFTVSLDEIVDVAEDTTALC